MGGDHKSEDCCVPLLCVAAGGGVRREPRRLQGHLRVHQVERMRAGLGFLRRASLSGTCPLRRSRCSLGKAGNRRLVHQRHEEDSLRPNVFVAAAVRRRQPPTLEMPQPRSEEHTSELQSLAYLVCRLLLEKKKIVSHKYTRSPS